MKQFLFVVCVVALVVTPVAADQMNRGTSSGSSGTRTMTCGNVSYDDGEAVNASWFGGGIAGDPDYMYGVLFNLADFGFTPGAVEIVSFCASNDIDFGGPWSNVVFIYADSGGVPLDATVLGQGTISTGDGAGQHEIVLGAPVVLAGDFWLMNRGDASVGATDFNMEFDAGPGAGHSFVSVGGGIGGLTLEPDANYMLRATLQVATGPTPTVPAAVAGVPVPTMNRYGILAMIALLAGVGILVVIRRR